MKYPFLKATLFYGADGSTVVPVHKTESAPFPDFDTDNIDECVYLAMSVMSNQAGGFPCEGGRVLIDELLGSVLLTGAGWSIKWGGEERLSREPNEPLEKWLGRVENHLTTQTRLPVPYQVLAHAHEGGWNDAYRRPATGRVTM